jgi:CBS domain containing-hemolysin-like protein
MVTIIALVFITVGALLASLCAMADGALLALDLDDRLPPAIAELRARRERIHRALAFARVLGQLSAGVGVSFILFQFPAPGWVVALVVALAAFLLVGLSESTARSVGATRAVELAGRLSRLVVFIEAVLSPVVMLGEAIDRGLHAVLPPPAQDEEDRETIAEQFKAVVAAEAEVPPDEQVLLNGVFRLAQTEVHDIMMPRVDVVAVDTASTWREVVDLVRSSEHSRLPVYASTIDNVVGILYAKDLLPSVLAGREPAEGWQSLVRPPVIIPRSKPADRQLRDFQATRTHFAVVADEYGGTAGIITIEDVLEEIVGDIRDEYDVEEAPVEHVDEHRIRVSARLTLSELSELLHADFEREDIATVGGLVLEQVGRAPRQGESFQLNGFRVTVDKVERRRRVQRVTFEKVDGKAKGSGQGHGHAA